MTLGIGLSRMSQTSTIGAEELNEESLIVFFLLAFGASTPD